MRKLISTLTATLLLWAALCIPAQAAAYTDDMSDLDNNTIKTYNGLTPVSSVSNYPGGIASSIPGGNGLTYSSRSRSGGWADYRISGADTVTVGLYTRRGTFASAVDDTYALGFYSSDMGHISSQQITQAQYSPGKGTLYLRSGSSVRRALDVDTYIAFEPAADAPGDLVDYGVNVYAGSGSGSLSRVSLSTSSGSARLASSQYNSGLRYCYEELTYKIPSSATYIRVEINDFSSLDLFAGGAIRQNTSSDTMRTTLSSVRFSGSSLVLGKEESLAPATSSEPPSQSDSSVESASQSSGKSSSSSAKSSSKSSSSTPGSSTQSAASSSSASTFKFQRELPASSGGSTATTGKGGGIAVPDATSAAGEPPAPAEEPPEPQHWEPEVFHITTGSGSSSGFSTVVTIYIVGITGLIVVLLLRGRKP